ncbi:hypothetical protein ACIGGF_19195 [Rhodococcus sp. NPDC078407]|uniref:hypothetical protein n=1 Tax=Rhodococcus sp. NPDC078407 TaxID=3364509 RepID=UPI0037CCBC28
MDQFLFIPRVRAARVMPIGLHENKPAGAAMRPPEICAALCAAEKYRRTDNK